MCACGYWPRWNLEQPRRPFHLLDSKILNATSSRRLKACPENAAATEKKGGGTLLWWSRKRIGCLSCANSPQLFDQPFRFSNVLVLFCSPAGLDPLKPHPYRFDFKGKPPRGNLWAGALGCKHSDGQLHLRAGFVSTTQIPHVQQAPRFCLSCSVTLGKKGNPFWGRPFLVGQPPKKGKKGASEQLSTCRVHRVFCSHWILNDSTCSSRVPSLSTCSSQLVRPAQSSRSNLPFPFFPGILLSTKPPNTLGKQLLFEKNDG